MDDKRVLYANQPLLPIARTPLNKPQQVGVKSGEFGLILERQLSQVKFSQHALQRMASRDINLGSEQLGRLQNAVDKAAQKGAKEALVLMDNNLAFVVSVKNRTVITAVDGESMKDNVFTNIDSAVIV